jgi:ABC-type branched-subunit amino acid transport system substrate-binding protein
VYIGGQGLPPDGLELTPKGERFVRDFGAGAHAPYAMEAAQATEVVLAAIARSDGTRASVLRELRATKVTDGILGSFAFDRHGDVTLNRIAVYRVTGATPPAMHVWSQFEGAVIDRIVTVPRRLVE